MKVVILSRNKKLYSTKRLIEEGKNKGYSIEVIDPLECILELEKKKPGIYVKGRFLNNVNAVIPRIGASVTFYGTAVVRQFEMMKVFTTVESVALVRSRDKLRSLQILSRAGVGLPKTVFTNYNRDVSHIIDSVGGAPVVIKVLEGTQGLGVVLAETKKAAESVLEAFNGLKARVIVQEYIREAKGADIRAFVIGGNVVGAMKRQAKEGEFRSNLHRGGTAEIIELSEDEETAAIKAAKAMGLGIAGVDLLQSERGPLILEVNSSPGLEGIEKATGKNIANLIYKYIRQHTD